MLIVIMDDMLHCIISALSCVDIRHNNFSPWFYKDQSREGVVHPLLRVRVSTVRCPQITHRLRILQLSPDAIHSVCVLVYTTLEDFAENLKKRKRRGWRHSGKELQLKMCDRIHEGRHNCKGLWTSVGYRNDLEQHEKLISEKTCSRCPL